MIKEALQSVFIVNKIKATSWEDRKYINHLMLLLRLMKKSKLSAAEGQLYFLLRNKYEEEYLQLLKETAPERYRFFIEDRELQHKHKEAEMESQEQRIAKQISRELAEYKQWIAIQKEMN